MSNADWTKKTSTSAGSEKPMESPSTTKRTGIIRSTLRTTGGRIGASLLLGVILLTIVGQFVAGDTVSQGVVPSFASPSAGYPLGGDVLGRDVWARVLAGGWDILAASVSATIAGTAIGTTIGMLAAYGRGLLDAILMRTVDVVLAVPAIILALVLIAGFGSQFWVLVLAVSLAHAPQVARVVRSTALDLTDRDYVKVAELSGASLRTILRREILPGLVSPLAVEFGLRFAYSILIISSLSFLGFGPQPGQADWGAMIDENRGGLALNAWGTIAPCVLIALLSVGANTISDAVAQVVIGKNRQSSTPAAIESVVVTPAGAPKEGRPL